MGSEKKWLSVALTSLLLLLSVADAFAGMHNSKDSEMRNLQKEEPKSLQNLTMAARLAHMEETLSKHAVDDPEEVAFMVTE
nr:probable pectate lyase 8 [Ipomoea batatas]